MNEEKRMGRRRFMKALAATGLALPLGGPIITGPRRQRQDEDWTVHVFSKHLQFLDYEAMAETAAEIGFDGVDLTVRPGGHVPPERVEKDLPRAVDAVRRAGLQAFMMTSAITDTANPYTRPVLETAAAQGIRYYRLGYYGYDEDEPPEAVLARHRAKVRRLAEMNAQLGLRGDYQNHAGAGYVGAPVWDLAELLDGLNPRWTGIQYDIRHATVEGGRSWPLGLRRLQRHVSTLVLKDFRWAFQEGRWRIENVPIGEGMVDFGAYFRLLSELGIAAPITVHFEYPIAEEIKDPVEKRSMTMRAMEKDLRQIRRFLAEAGLRP